MVYAATSAGVEAEEVSPYPLGFAPIEAFGNTYLIIRVSIALAPLCYGAHIDGLGREKV